MMAEATDSEIVIRVRDLAKWYQIYEHPRDRLKQFLLPRLQRVVGVRPKRYFREFRALNGISFEIARGESVGIIGRNGSGKSTLLQIIAGTLVPTHGEVETKGRVAALLELGSGFNPEFTGRENVYMNAALLGLEKQEVEARMDDILAFADIGEFVDRPVKTYSSGMYLRLAFAVVAHVDADVLIVDEALAVGDAFFTQKCMRFLRGFMERGTVLFVSHDTAAVKGLCNRVLWLHEGKLKEEGEPKEVTEHYLEDYYGSGEGSAARTARSSKTATKAMTAKKGRKDQRQRFLQSPPLRNEIRLFGFDESSEGFGQGGASIVSVGLYDEDGGRLAWVVGGEDVTLRIEVKVNLELQQPIVGFFVKDRLGQTLFGDNTYLTTLGRNLHVRTGDILVARFSFQMPRLPCGDYSLCVAVADGTNEEHVQHHWIHDALIFRSESSNVANGLIGIPMLEISLETGHAPSSG